jgi:hypothetical protein
MKAARLNGDLLSRKGDARPVPGFAPAHGKSTDRSIRPALATVEAGSAGPMPESVAQRPQGKCASDLKCDKFGRVRISLRLDPQRHLRLRLLAWARRLKTCPARACTMPAGLRPMTMAETITETRPEPPGSRTRSDIG